MRGVLLTARKDLARRLRNPLELLLWLGIPLAIGLLLRLAFGGQTSAPRATLLVATEIESELFEFTLGILEDQSAVPIQVELVADTATGIERIEAGEASAFVALPENLMQAVLDEEPLELELLTNPAERIRPGLIEESLGLFVETTFYAQRLFAEPLNALSRTLDNASAEERGPTSFEIGMLSNSISTAMNDVGETLFPPLLNVEFVRPPTEATEDDGAEYGFAEMFLPSLLILALVFMSTGLSEDLWVEKTSGTLRRALSLPGGAHTFLLGKLLACLCVQLAVAVVGMLLAGPLFGIQIHHPLVAALWAALAGFFFTCALFALQSFCRSQRTGALLSSLMIMPLLMAGGSFFPFEVMPSWLAQIGMRTPNGWALLRFQEIILDQIDFGALLVAAAGLLIGCIGMFLLARWRISGKFGSAA